MAHGDEEKRNVRDLTASGRARRGRHEEKGSTLSIFLPPQADWGLREELMARMCNLAEEIFKDRVGWDPAMVAMIGDVLQIDCDEHVYLSTSCLHDEHEYCQSETGLLGQKVPASCKFCKADCICPCHAKTPDREGLAKREEEEDDEQSAPDSPAGPVQAAAA